MRGQIAVWHLIDIGVEPLVAGIGGILLGFLGGLAAMLGMHVGEEGGGGSPLSEKIHGHVSDGGFGSQDVIGVETVH